ncbi:hypothetical protein VP1G_04044 [Cytospora mali]|uniref:Rhodopsin domain-containing protein n=1 Tax=Cytospora mali TaxID=578113 RepID=A0A194UY97_CYTMA|nr:hypothetical protein VP1G_04044 [Valsa mali var. pyri (nom. inval.)]
MAPTLTPQDIAYMQAHASDSLKINIIVCCAVCGVASLLFVIARIWSRRLSAAKLQQSDWMVIVAWFVYIALLGTFIGIIPYGGGKHVIFLTNPRMFAILMICNEVLYCTVMGLIKISLLAMYGSIFPQQRFRWVLWFTAFLVVSWVIYGSLTGILQCVPVQALWDTSITNAHCITYGTLVIVAGVQNILLDFIILTLPIPMIWRLSMSKQKKNMLIFTFAMGGSAFIVSIIRQAYVGKVGSTADSTWDDMPAALVSVVELMAGFLAASIPTYRPLWRYLFPRGDRNDKANSFRSSGQIPYTKEGVQWHGNVKTQTKVSTGVGMAKVRNVNDFGGISVTRDIELSTHSMAGGSRDDGWLRVSDDGSEDNLRRME